LYVCVHSFMRSGYARVKGTSKVNSLIGGKGYITKAMVCGRGVDASQIISGVRPFTGMSLSSY
jgi:hypothetical protein